MNGIQPLNSIKYINGIQLNRNNNNNNSVNRQQNNPENFQMVTRVKHQNEDNTQTTYNSNGEKQQVPNVVSTFEGVA